MLTEDLREFLVPQIGTALLTTIIGLVARQFIVTSDPVHEAQAGILQAATDELKENISAYRLAQQNLLQLIDDFTITRSELIEEEQRASKEHLALLTESSSALGKLGRQYPPGVRLILRDKLLVK